MTFIIDSQELKPGLIVFRRGDVKHKNWYCRVRIPGESDRYKTLSLGIADLHQAKEKAFDHDADIRFRVRHEVPIFDRSFEQVAKEYSDFHKSLAESGQITMNRWKIVDSYIRLHLIPYAGNVQITALGDRFSTYPQWRKKQVNADGSTPKGGTIEQEMKTFRAILRFAADKGYIRENQIPRNKIPKDKARREEFTPKEYRHLHTFARSWIKEARTDHNEWYRKMTYEFILVMCNTGMRTLEAKNLRWRDVDTRLDNQGRTFATFNVRGKKKYRELVAAHNVVEYLERVKKISKALSPDDFVFSTHKGKQASSLYGDLISDLLTKSELLISSSGSRRSSYCFRHTYATFRLMEGIDVYFLAKQMGTSVKMIEDYYGHITPVKNAERILQGIPGWEPIKAEPEGTSSSVNANAPKVKAVKTPHTQAMRGFKGKERTAG